MERRKNHHDRKERPAWVKWYKTAAWHRLRYKQLSREPLCRFCQDNGKVVAGNVADHIKPHRGDAKLFYLLDNLQTLCGSCHSATKQRLEKSGEFGCDINGIVPGWK